MSLCAIAVMTILFFSETWAFARTSLVTSIGIDENDQPQIRLNFNITLLDLHCDFVSVDVWDALGTNKQNVTRNVDKWQLDADGTRRIFSGRNRDIRQVQQQEHAHTLEEMHEENEGSYVTDLTSSNFKEFLEEHEMAFIEMFAPWYVCVSLCVHLPHGPILSHTTCCCTFFWTIFCVYKVCVVSTTCTHMGKVW
jgi:hypothetical protein